MAALPKQSLESLFKTHKVAKSIKQIWDCLENHLKGKSEIYVRSLLHQELYPLSDVVAVPFHFNESTDEMMSFYKKDNVMMSFRMNPNDPEIVQMKNIREKEWFTPALGGIRIYIPK